MLRFAYIALFGLFSFTVVCPVTMGSMPMDMGSMQTASQVSQDQDGDTGAMPCEQCKEEKEEIVASFGPQTEVLFLATISTASLAFWELSEPLSTNHQIHLFANRPPIPTETLVGTVILRT
ncbi:hypothetical protein COU77_04320 [Candidatus Peregrinibacteria bacterium CG10_big_fil_rev_8_21_14_0_10_49_16]|nr:MAG: hypothetical protein COU77_04320 [Candidatus Peregrinibacteria bacterium CG10_big_fil_rev_8_21_14_0_10_49_16]